MLERRPLLWWSAAYMLGCWLGCGWMPDARRLAVVTGLWAVWAGLRRCPASAIVVFMCLGAALSSRARLAQVDPYRNGPTVEVVGVVEEVPRHGVALLRVGVQAIRVHDPRLSWRDVVRCQGVLQAVDGPRNPLEPDRRTPGVWHQMWPARVRVLGRDESDLWGVCLWLRERLQTGIGRLWPGSDGDVLRGLLLGDTSAMPRSVASDMARTGTSHLLVANGLKVAAVGVLVAGLMGCLPLDVRGRALLTALATLGYAGACGAGWPVLRATCMVLIAVLADVTGHAYDAPNALAATALLLGGIDPLAPLETSFALSFWVMAGILVLREPFEGLLERWPAPLRKVVVLTLAVQVTLAPWEAFTDHVLSLGSVLANLLVVPPLEIAVMLGLPLAGLAGAGLLCPAGAALVRLLLTLSLGLLGRVPTWPLYVPGRAVSIPGRLQVTFLDVNQGDAAVVTLPDGQVMMVDSGPVDPESGVDEGARVVAPYLLRAGETHVALAVISHPHLDHYGGLPAVLQTASVASVVECGLAGSGALWDAYRTCVPHPLRWRAGDVFDMAEGVHLEVLHPGPVISTQPNNASVVFRMTYGRVSFLFCGDAEKEAEAEMLERSPGQLAATVLKVPHHGSATSSTAEFLAAVHPAVAVVSVGRHNRFHLPNPDTMARLQRMVPTVFRTDRDGGVVVATDGLHLWTQATVTAGRQGTPP